MVSPRVATSTPSTNDTPLTVVVRSLESDERTPRIDCLRVRIARVRKRAATVASSRQRVGHSVDDERTDDVLASERFERARYGGCCAVRKCRRVYKCSRVGKCDTSGVRKSNAGRVCESIHALSLSAGFVQATRRRDHPVLRTDCAMANGAERDLSGRSSRDASREGVHVRSVCIGRRVL